jgi:hypothetical protein
MEEGCGHYQLTKTCKHFNKFLMRQQNFALLMLAHDPHLSAEEIIMRGRVRLYTSD